MMYGIQSILKRHKEMMDHVKTRSQDDVQRSLAAQYEAQTEAIARLEAETSVITLPPGMTFAWPREYLVQEACLHEFVNVSFAHIKMVCRHCDREQR